MNKKIGCVKITICAAFFALFAASFFFVGTGKFSAFKTVENNSDNPQNCAACHRENHASQHRNLHQKTVEKATTETVQGDFESENHLKYNGEKVEMRRDGESFYISIGEENYKVEAVVGAKYIEQYVARRNGEFYSLPIAYNLTEKRWVNLNEADFERKDADFSRHLQNWKTDCAACHRSGENELQDGFTDFGISCGACHGNTAEHLASKTSVWARLGFQTENKIINPNNLSSDAAMLVCAKCHSRDLNNLPQSAEITAGQSTDNLISAHRQNHADSERYFANGANKFSGNEFQSIVRSVCYVQSKSGGRGIEGEKINCASCHSMHETTGANLQTEQTYNQNCINCHTQFSDKATVAEHTKHSINSAASNCASCHQPETVYGRMRFERTHEISVPNPSLTAEKGVPNACNLCHADKSVNWAITSGKKLWAERFRAAEISRDKQFDRPEGIRVLSSNDAFRRALAADSLRKHSALTWSAPILFNALQREETPLVEQIIADTLKSGK